jgi:hypothetical protein
LKIHRISREPKCQTESVNGAAGRRPFGSSRHGPLQPRQHTVRRLRWAAAAC